MSIISKDFFQVYSDGKVTVLDCKNKEYCYQNCPEHLYDSKKTVRLQQKLGYLLYYDFESGIVIKCRKDGEIFQKTGVM